MIAIFLKKWFNNNPTFLLILLMTPIVFIGYFWPVVFIWCFQFTIVTLLVWCVIYLIHSCIIEPAVESWNETKNSQEYIELQDSKRRQELAKKEELLRASSKPVEKDLVLPVYNEESDYDMANTQSSWGNSTGEEW